MECAELKIPPLSQLVTVGHGMWRPGMIHFERRFQVYDLLFVIRGSHHMTEEGTAYDLGEGGVLLLEPGLTHVGHRETTIDTELYWVHFIHAAPERHVPHDKINWSQPLRHGTDADLSPSEQFMYLPKFAHLDLNPFVPECLQASTARCIEGLYEGLRYDETTNSPHCCEFAFG
jgi:hypothetical protein